MPERHAHILEVLICQVGEYGNVDFVLGKELGVLTEVELSEPVRNLHLPPPAVSTPPVLDR
jgi:hypothetical protein